MKEIKLNEYWINMFQTVESNLADFVILFEFWKAGDATELETQEAFDTAILSI